MSVSFNLSAPTMPTTQGHTCQGKHKKRLIVGEGDFSFTEALINKHDKAAKHTLESSLAHSIVATDYKGQDNCDDCMWKRAILEFQRHDKWKSSIETSKSLQPPALCDRCTRIQELPKRGVKVLLGIDGTKLHETESLKSFKFSRIHWNCPHDGKSITEQTLPVLIEKFFKSCAKVQRVSDRIHITLAQPTYPPKQNYFYQGYYYYIVKAASLTGYVLIKSRRFGPNRYKGYHHVQTNNNISAPVTDKGLVEFVFKKLDEKSFKNTQEYCQIDINNDLPYHSIYFLAKNLAKYSEKSYDISNRLSVNGGWRPCYEYLIDNDSSSYESDESNESLNN